MATVRLPSPLQPLAGGATSVAADGATLRGVVADLERQFPGMEARIVEAGAIRPDVLVAIDGDETRDLDAAVGPISEVHILPAIAGGKGSS